MEIISCADAKAKGQRFYFTGKPCRRGHIAQRYVAQKLCVECARNAASQQRERDPEGCKRALKEWQQRNKERYYWHATKWQREKPEEYRAYRKRYQQENKDQLSANTRAWRDANRDRWDEAAREWQAANKERLTVARRNRRARVRNADGSHTLAEITELLKKQRYRCAACRKSIRAGFHADHVMPLFLGGSNDIGNIQLLCKSCNSGKGAKHPDDWARDRGLLL